MLFAKGNIGIITVVYPIRNGHFKMADCTSSKRFDIFVAALINYDKNKRIKLY
jgi:hypothetical protein